MRCAALCPEQAVEAGHSWGFVAGALTSVPVLYLILTAAPDIGFENLYDKSVLLRDVVYYANWFFAVMLAYPLFWLANKIPIVNKFFAATTFTHYWGRYKLPGHKAKDFKKKFRITDKKR